MTHFFPEPADASERALLDRVAQWDGARDLADFTPELLVELMRREGSDFATALLHHRIVASEEHGPFLRALREPEGSGAARSGSIHVEDNVSHERPVVAIVPGAFYRENPRTGADGQFVREVAERLGLPVVTAPLSSTGRLAENAQLLVEWLATQRARPLVLVSVSKGGSDLKVALQRPDAGAAFAHVRGWINLCGILDGTPMAEWLLSSDWLARANRFVYRIRGRSLDFLEDMQRRPGSPLAGPLVLPPHLRTIHVVGFPLLAHLRNGLVRRCHARLAPFGPNDGSLLLSDVIRWHGQLCPVWGADHYLRPSEDVRPLLAALLGGFLA
ncbi:MAG TPA: hypothetical protein VGO11_08135 [Chthoniobacteraceae bacterium]|jgi:hypothetical protein|nr:hypothetical protein [Chthoniobacteraceae bacterium]